MLESRRPKHPFRRIILHSLGLASLQALCPGSLLAHGGLAESTNIVFEDPTDPLPLVVTTFGILAPKSAHDWTWVCQNITSEPTLTAFTATPAGTWLMGTIGGIWRSADRCYWKPVEGDVADLYITQLSVDTVDPSRLYASSSTTGRTNGIWVSEDEGETFSLFANFGEISTVRNFEQSSDGSHWAAVAWIDNLPYLMRSPDGESWTQVEIPASSTASIYLLGIDRFDTSTCYLTFRDQGADTLVRVSPESDFETLITIPDQITAFDTGFSSTELWVGGRYEGMYHSSDDGATWTGPELIPESGCLTTVGSARYQCTNNYADGASVWRTTESGGDPTLLAWFGDVHAVESCPADSETTTICGPLWETQKYTVGMDLSETPSPTPIPDADDGIFGCTQSGGRGGSPFAVATILLMVGGTLWRRRESPLR